jgi:transposase
LKESDEFVIFDNASIQVEEGSLAVVDNVTDGLWKRIPPYNPRLAPIERGFAMVWQEVRRNEKEALADPIGTIHKAFEKYSVIGPEGYKSKSSILYIN